MDTALHPEELLEPLNEEELVLKQYYYAKQQEDTFRAFLDKVAENPELISTVYIPECNNNTYTVFTEQIIFQGENENITVCQHRRYSPVFEHKHTIFEIVYVLKGQCENTVDGCVMSLHTGDLCIVAPNVTHALAVFDNSLIINILIRKTTFNETFFKLLSTDNLLSSFFNKILYANEFNNYINFHTQGDVKLKTLLDYLICESFVNDRFSSVCMESLLMSAFSILLRNHSNNAELSHTTNPKFSKVVHVIQYIRENYKTVTLDSVSRYFNYATPYLSRMIKEATGMTFSDIVADIKYNKAVMLLLNTDMTVLEISEAAGFGSTEHFHRTFKKKSGVTPVQFRSQHQNPKNPVLRR